MMHALASINLVAAIVLLVVGALSCLGSSNLVKRVVGLFVAMVGGLLALTALGVSGALLLAASAAGGAQLLAAIAIVIRVQEEYGSIETSEIDTADRLDEPAEAHG